VTVTGAGRDAVVVGRGGAAVVGLAVVPAGEGDAEAETEGGGLIDDALGSGAADEDGVTLGSGSAPTMPGGRGVEGAGVPCRSPDPTE
jgi:hypothetical protein